jgi:hypothetical protein
LPQSVTDELWMRMASRYGHAWVSQYGPIPDGIAAAEWRSTLAGLTGTQLGAGFAADRARGSEWPPSSTKFRAMCFAIPSLPVVTRAVLGKEPATPFVRLVWQKIDRFRLKQADVDKADRLIRDAYEIACEHVIQGGELPPDPMALIEKTEPVRTPAPPEVAAEHIAKLAELLKTEPVTPHTEIDP